MNTIISKRLTTFTYQQYKFENGQYLPIGNGVLINGGAGVVGGADLLSGRPLEKRNLFVPGGVATEVSDEVLEYLMGCWKFRKDIDRGIITVLKGERASQDRADKIAECDMLPSEQISGRPYSEEDIENAGGKINRDGSVDISEAAEDIDLIRRRNAGQPFYVKNREAEARKAKAAARKARTSRKNK